MFHLRERKVHSVSMHQLIFSICSEKRSGNDLVKYAKEEMLKNLCEEIENMTRNQKDNLLWHEMRFGRITASILYAASKYRTADGSLVHQMIGAAKVYEKRNKSGTCSYC